MGFFRWSHAWVYSGTLLQLDGSSVLGCVKSPKITMSDDETSDVANDNYIMAAKAIAEKYVGRGLTSVVVSEKEERVLEPYEKLVFIPKFGYLLVNTEQVPVKLEDGGTAFALVGTRILSLKGKKSNFYLFDNDSGRYSGSIGRYRITMDELGEKDENEKASFHFQIVSYSK